MRGGLLMVLSILGAGCAAGGPWSGPEGRTVGAPARGGKVVLREMWTFGCINCQRVVPHVQAWHEAYASQGLVVIGNHFPEFAHERDLDALRQAVELLGVTYAVAPDNDGATWRAYTTHYWPTLYLIDKLGQ